MAQYSQSAAARRAYPQPGWLPHLDSAKQSSLPSAAPAITCTSGYSSEPLCIRCFIAVQLQAGNISALPCPGASSVSSSRWIHGVVARAIPSCAKREGSRSRMEIWASSSRRLSQTSREREVHHPLWKLARSGLPPDVIWFLNLSKSTSAFTTWERSEKIHCCH